MITELESLSLLTEEEIQQGEETARTREEVRAAKRYFEVLIPQKYPGTWSALCVPRFTITYLDTPEKHSETVSVSAIRTATGDIATFVDLPDTHERLDLTSGTEYEYTIKNGDIIPGKGISIAPKHIDTLSEIAYHLHETRAA